MSYRYYDDMRNCYKFVTESDAKDVIPEVERINGLIHWGKRLDNEDKNMMLFAEVFNYYYDVVGISNGRLSALIQLAVDKIFPVED